MVQREVDSTRDVRMLSSSQMSLGTWIDYDFQKVLASLFG